MKGVKISAAINVMGYFTGITIGNVTLFVVIAVFNLLWITYGNFAKPVITTKMFPL